MEIGNMSKKTTTQQWKIYTTEGHSEVFNERWGKPTPEDSLQLTSDHEHHSSEIDARLDSKTHKTCITK